MFFCFLFQLRICKENFYITYNGRLASDTDILCNGSATIKPRFFGGKGGFGSMLRAIGAQIEKTTNREACRDPRTSAKWSQHFRSQMALLFLFCKSFSFLVPSTRQKKVQKYIIKALVQLLTFQVYGKLKEEEWYTTFFIGYVYVSIYRDLSISIAT